MISFDECDLTESAKLAGMKQKNISDHGGESASATSLEQNLLILLTEILVLIDS